MNDPYRLKEIVKALDSEDLPDNDLEVIRVLLCTTSGKPLRRISTGDRKMIARYLYQLCQALILSGYALSALLVRELFWNFCRRARLRIG